MKVLFVNLTPHTVNLPDREIPSISTVRLDENVQEIGTVDNIPLLRVTYDKVILAENTIKKIEEQLEKIEDRVILVLIVSGMFDSSNAERLVRRVLTYISMSNFIKIQEILVVAPYTGTHAKYTPEREKGIIKYIKAFRLLYRVRMK